MIPAINLATILLMAVATYCTRVGGYFLLRNRTLSPRARVVLEAAPGCVFLSVIAPHFVLTRPADLVALAVTVVAAFRLPMLATVAVSVATAGILRHLIG